MEDPGHLPKNCLGKLIVKKRVCGFWHIHFDNWLFGISEPVFKKTLREDPGRLRKSYLSKFWLVFYELKIYLSHRVWQWNFYTFRSNASEIRRQAAQELKHDSGKAIAHRIGRSSVASISSLSALSTSSVMGAPPPPPPSVHSEWKFPKKSAIILGESDYMFKKVHAKKSVKFIHQHLYPEEILKIKLILFNL